MTEEKKLALLIDSDNVSAKYAQFILQEAAKYGELTYKRVYGDWEKGGNGWHYPALNNSIMPVQQTAYIAGKNATDFSMIIDAMDILYTGNVDGFVLVTSDSDFTRLAIRLREAGKIVVGIGEVKTPLPFTSSCHHFSYLNQICEPAVNFDEKTLRNAVIDYVSENDDGKLDLLKIQAFLTSKYGSVDYAAIGFNRFSNFIDSFSELRRNNTFVTLKRPAKKPAEISENLPTEREITEVIIGYLQRKGGGHDDLSSIEKYVTSALGKIDFSRFGSKRFAKFIDKQSAVIRKGNVVYLSEQNPVPKAEIKSEINEQKITAKVTLEEFTEDVRAYAGENMPNGGNLGQLNNMLIEKYGKSYISDLGFDDFAKAVLSVTAVKVSKNHVFTKAENTPKAKPAQKPKPASSEKAEGSGKPELNAVKREIQILTVQHENSISLSALGKILRRKYGENYLKEVGESSLKTLVSSVAGIKVSGNSAKMDADFVKRTEQIERFVCDFVAKSGKPSIKSLSSSIKKNFEGFDFTDYGYARFSDFINAIDGVRADGYYVEAE